MKKQPFLLTALFLALWCWTANYCCASPEIIRVEVFDVKVTEKLPAECFLEKSGPHLRMIDAETLYRDLSSLEKAGVLTATRLKMFLEPGQEEVLDQRQAIPGSDEQEGVYLWVSAEVTEKEQLQVTVMMEVSEIIQWVTEKQPEDGPDKKWPILSAREIKSAPMIVSGRPTIIGGAGGTPEIKGLDSNYQYITMLRATRYYRK